VPDAAGFDPVVFDLDGTVVDTVELIVESFRHATRAVLDEALPDEVILAGVGQQQLAVHADLIEQLPPARALRGEVDEVAHSR